jgi:hypothetical protein
MLAIFYVCQKVDHYIYGRQVVIETDHKLHRYYLKEKPYLACHKYTFPYPERTRYTNHTVATSLTYVEDAV